jgi:DNA polymerase III alpha subunit
VAYWTAYLKVNYTSEFMASNMTSRLDAKPKLLTVIEDCRKRGIEVLPPDVNESNQDFTVVGPEKNSPIRFGLQAIKGLGAAPITAVLAARREGGRFISLHDFCERVPARACSRSCLETLIKAGAFDSIAPNRQAMLEAMDSALASGLKAQADSASGQGSLFDEPTGEVGRPKTVTTLPDVPDVSRDQRLQWEKELVGLFISDHPLGPLRAYLEANTVTLDRVGEDPEFVDGTKVTLGGMITTAQKRTDKNGRTWSIFTLEDLTDSIEVLAFSKAYEKCGELIEEDAKVLVTGRLSADTRGGARQSAGDDEATEQIRYKLMADEIKPIPMAKAEAFVAATPPRSAAEAPTAPAPQPATNGVKGHILLEEMAKQNNGHNGSNGNGAGPHQPEAGTANGGGVSVSRSHVTPRSLPETPAPSATYAYEEAGPARISRSFSPPVTTEPAVHVYIPAEAANETVINRLYSICAAHHGPQELWLHLDNGVEMVQLKVSASFWVNPNDEFCACVQELVGPGNIAL